MYKVIFAFLMACILLCQPLHAQELTKIESIIITTPKASTMLMAEIADTEELRGRGLMFRHILPPDHAMLFDFIKPRPAAMWMKNTYMSLDMLFVREDGSIAAIAENTVPKSLDTISVQEPVRSVIELAAGTAKRLNIHQNDVVFHRIFKTE
jgi:uncharacterized membrane protein (UPF0127 family)